MFYPTASKSESGDDAHKMATILHNALRQRRLVVKPSMPKSWVIPFRTLCRERDKARVLEILTWYCEHLAEEFVPQAYTATAFLTKFPQIERSFETSDDNAVIRPDERAKTLAIQLLNELEFPPEVVGLLPSIVFRTRKRWIEFIGTACDIPEDQLPEPSTRHRMFLEQLRDSIHDFVVQWCVVMSQRLYKLEHYSHPPLGLAFHPDSQVFRNSFWQNWSRSWTGSAHTYDSLLDWLIANEKKGRK
jgi:hypothetical protein